MKSYIRRIGATLLLASFCCRLLRRRFNPKHLRGGFMVALKVSLHKSPATYRAQALRVDPISKLLATKLKCVASTECPNCAHPCQ